MTAAAPGKAPTELLASLKEGGEVKIADVRETFQLNRRQAYNAISRLENRGFLRWDRLGVWIVTDAGIQAAQDGFKFTSGPNGPTGVVPRPKHTFRQRAWAAMRIRGRFTIGDIVGDAGGDAKSEKQDTENATRFIRQLRKAGVVSEFKHREKGSAIGSNGFKRFLLTKNLGPLAPAYRAKTNTLHDFNTGEDIPCDQA